MIPLVVNLRLQGKTEEEICDALREVDKAFDEIMSGKSRKRRPNDRVLGATREFGTPFRDTRGVWYTRLVDGSIRRM